MLDEAEHKINSENKSESNVDKTFSKGKKSRKENTPFTQKTN